VRDRCVTRQYTRRHNMLTDVSTSPQVGMCAVAVVDPFPEISVMLQTTKRKGKHGNGSLVSCMKVLSKSKKRCRLFG
jgi:hypothetical protein